MRDRYRDNYEDSPVETRELGLRRLGRLTWRTTQLGALATVGFAIVFARTASTPAANVQVVPSTQPPTTTSAPPAAQLGAKKPTDAASTPAATQSTVPPAQPTTPAVTVPTPKPATQAPAPTPKPTLSPPTTAPKPAPSTSSPAPTATSTTHGGG